MRLGIKEAYDASKDRLNGMTLEQFNFLTSPFNVLPMYAEGRLCGALLSYQNHIHACILPWAEGKWFSRKAVRFLNNIIKEFGEATTTATTEKGRNFVLSLGFVQDGEIYRSNKKWVLNRS